MPKALHATPPCFGRAMQATRSKPPWDVGLEQKNKTVRSSGTTAPTGTHGQNSRSGCIQPATATGTHLHHCSWRRSSCWRRSSWRCRTASRAACDSAASAQLRMGCPAPRPALSSLCCPAQHKSTGRTDCAPHVRPQPAAGRRACACSARLACCSWPPACCAHACCNPCRAQGVQTLQASQDGKGATTGRGRPSTQMASAL